MTGIIILILLFLLYNSGVNETFYEPSPRNSRMHVAHRANALLKMPVQSDNDNM